MKIIDKIGSAFLRQVLLRMKRLGLNQSALAQRMKVSRPYISKVMKGDVNITFATAAKLAKALQMDFFPDLREHDEQANRDDAEGRSDAESNCQKQLNCKNQRKLTS